MLHLSTIVVDVGPSTGTFRYILVHMYKKSETKSLATIRQSCQPIELAM